MATQSNEIGDIVKKVKVLLLDIEGTTTSISFVKDKLFPYVEEKVHKFLTEQWEEADVKTAVAALRSLALEDEEKSVEGLVKIPGEDATKEDQIEGLVNNVKWQMSSDRKVGALKQLQGLIWKQGYDNGDIKGHVYEDVSPAIEQWHNVDSQKVYIYSSGSVQAQKLLFGQSLAGDLLKFIDGHFDTGVGAKQEAASYTKIVEEIGVKPEEILFLTDILKEGEAARSAGLHVALLSREGNAPLPDDVAATFPVLHSFAQLATTLKRKPDTQEEPAQPAKVPKTDAEETKTSATGETSAKIEPVQEKMEVEEEVKENTEQAKEDTTAKVEVIVKDVTESAEAVDATVVTTESLLTKENVETKNNDEKEAEHMETEVVVEAPNDEVEKNGAAETPVAEETPPTVITEIKDITDEKQSLEEVAENIEDLVPVVEEPQSMESDMAELQNVGEVLDKECDEILSKVQDVTNLDSIVAKPMLNSISEENMENENMDTNDIVDSILDNEQESEEKKVADLVTKEKESETTEANGVLKEVSAETPTETSSTVEKVTKSNADAPEPKVGSSETKMESPESKVETSETNKVENSETKEQNPEKVKTSENKVEAPETKVETPETKIKTPETKVVTPETKVETPATKVETPETKVETPETKVKTPETKVETPESKVESSIVTDETKVEESSSAEAKPADKTVTDAAQKPDELTTTTEKDVLTETKGESIAEEKKAESIPESPQVNGSETNGNSDAVNGDASKEEELSSRLAAENGKEAVNGANNENGSSNGSEGAEAEKKIEAEVSDIKVKSVAAETRTDPIEQATEA